MFYCKMCLKEVDELDDFFMEICDDCWDNVTSDYITPEKYIEKVRKLEE